MQLRRRALLEAAAAVALLGYTQRAHAQTIAPGERALSASQVDELVAGFRAQQREMAARLAVQQQALRQTEEELRRVEQFYREQLEQLSRETDPQRLAAIAYYSSGRRVEALDRLIEIQRAEQARVAKDQASSWRQIAALAFGVDTRRAIEAFEQVLTYAPGDYEAALLLTDLYIQSGQPDRALASARRAATQAPPGPPRFQVLVAAGRSLLASGDVEQATTFFEDARALMLTLLGDRTHQGEALRLSYYFAFQYGSLHSAIGNLSGAEQWFANQIAFLRSQLATGLFPADLQYAFPMTLLAAAGNSTRLGLKQQSLARVRELVSFLSRLEIAQVNDSNLLALVSGAQSTIASVALRFDTEVLARSSAETAIESARRAVSIDPANSYMQLTLASALSAGAWVATLTNQLSVAGDRADEAVSVANALYIRNHDFFSSLIYAIALFYQGVQRFLAGDRASAIGIVEEALRIIDPYGSLSVQNATLGLTVWYLRAAVAALGLGSDWRRFESESLQMVSARGITQYELDYVRAVRIRLFEMYNIALPR
jgi:tetratricopeptide (TPR) repeat protein